MGADGSLANDAVAISTQTDPSSSGKVAGDLNAFTIFDLTQLMMMSQKSGLVTIDCDGLKGYVYFDNGQIVSVTDDSLFQGTAAAFRVFLWQGGRFELDTSKQTSEKNIRLSTENLMLDIARRLDEANLGDQEASDVEQPPLTTTLNKGEESIEKIHQERLRQINKSFAEIAQSVMGIPESTDGPLLDRLTRILSDREGDAVFMIPGSRPRIRVDGILHEISEFDPWTEDSAKDMVESELPPGLAARLFNDRVDEIQYTIRKQDQVPYKMVVSAESGTTIISLHTLTDAVKAASALAIPTQVLETISRPGGGIVLLAGQPNEALDTILAGIVGRVVAKSGSLAALLLQSLDFDLKPPNGLVIMRQIRAQAQHLSRALRRTAKQRPQIIGISHLHGFEVAEDVISLARMGVSVLCGFEGNDLDETLAHLAEQEAILAQRRPSGETLIRYLRALMQTQPRESETGKLAAVLSGTKVANNLTLLRKTR